MATQGKKKPIWVSVEAHEALREFCERTGRTQLEVLSELLYRYVQPELEKAEAADDTASSQARKKQA